MSQNDHAVNSIRDGLSIELLEPLVLLSASCGGHTFGCIDTVTGCDEGAGCGNDPAISNLQSCSATASQTDLLEPTSCESEVVAVRQEPCMSIGSKPECVDHVAPGTVQYSSSAKGDGQSDVFHNDLLIDSDPTPHAADPSYDLLLPPTTLDSDRTGVEMELSYDSLTNEQVDVPQNAELDDAVLQWNDFFGELLVMNETQQNPGYASRAMAMLNVAMYDAVTFAQGESADTFYEHHEHAGYTSGVDAEAAAGQAAYAVLSSLYGGEQEFIDAFHHEFFACLEVDADLKLSIELGDSVGEQVVAARANDGSGYEVDYVFGGQPGDFRPDPLNPDVPVWGPSWGEVQTFGISSADDFSPPTTPPLTSAEYAASFNEVKELGAVDSSIRTAEQTEIGIFWAYDRTGMGTPMALFGNVLESVALNQGNTLEENAALFAQASVSMADAGIVAWDTKFSEEFWRPVTAIREAGSDGNPYTYSDPGWTALGAPDGGDDVIGFTPQFPTYISGHATFGGALFGAIRDFYGTDDISFDVTSKELEILMDRPELQQKYGLHLDDATRSFDSLSQAMAENGRSRVYLGIHFDFDDLVGRDVGEKVASAISPKFVVPSSNYYGTSSLA